MSDQIGRHDATGPLARCAYGRVDPEGYVRSVMQGRELILVHGILAVAYAILLLVRDLGWPGGLLAFAGLVLIDLAIVLAISCSSWWAERRRRHAGQWPSWGARLFVLQARSQAIAIPTAVRGDARLWGRLSDAETHWVWTPGRSARSKFVQPIDLAPGWVPRVTERIGTHGIATFDTGDQNGPRLDFWVSRRRALQRHLLR